MTNPVKTFLAALLCGLFLTALAHAQTAVLSGTPYTPYHAPMYVGSGQQGSQAVIIDSGPASGAAGVGMGEGLYVARCANPVNGICTNAGTGPSGANWCDYDTPNGPTNSGGYHYLCFNPNNGTAGTISYGAGGGAATLPLDLIINGSIVPFTGSLTIGSLISGGSSTAGCYGVLINKHGLLGDSCSDTSLSNGVTGPSVTISSNAAPIPNIASIVGGGVTAPLTVATADGGETIIYEASFGTNANATLAMEKARGTAASPLPLQAGDVIGTWGNAGWSTAGTSGGAPASATIESRAIENFSATHNGTGWYVFSQLAGTAYPSSQISMLQVNAGGLGGVTIGGVAANFYTPDAQDFGAGSLSMAGATGSLFINQNAAPLQAVPSTTIIHAAQSDSNANVALFDAFGNSNALIFRRADGTGTSPTTLQANDVIGAVGAYGLAGSAYNSQANANISFFASQNWTAIAQGTYIDLETTANGGSTRTSAIRIENDGGIRLAPATNPDSSFGLGTISMTGAIVINANTVASVSAPAGTLLHMTQANGVATNSVLDTYASSAGYQMRRSDGTQASPTTIQSGDLIGTFGAAGYNGSAFTSNRAAVAFTASQNWTTGAEGIEADVLTTPNGSITPAISTRFFPSGGVGVGETTADPGIGAIFLANQAFASLTSCSSTIKGALANVTDSTTNAWGGTIAGSGADQVLAYCDGTNWTVAAK